MYQKEQKKIFEGRKKFAVAADPSTYAGEKTMVAVVLDSEAKRACYAPVQIIPASKMLSPSDHDDMSDRLKLLAFEGKLERTSAYNEARALSSAVSKVSGLSLDGFQIPDNILWRPVEPGHVRCSRKSGSNIIPSVLRESDRTFLQAIPSEVDIGDLPQLTACLDSGSIGRAGMSFAKHKLCLFLFLVWDKFHRLVRDLKLAAEKASGGQMYRALLHMTFVFSLNSRPFGSGEWYWKKKEILAHYLDTHTADSDSFLAFAHLIAQDHGLQHQGDGNDHERVFNVLSALPSFQEKGASPKMMRWFSCNQMWHERKSEFWATKLILQHANANEDGPLAEVFDPAKVMQGNAKKELSALKAKHGGLSLAEKLITPWLRSRIKIYTTATSPSWTWYTNQVENVKTPRDGLAFNMRQSCGGWQVELSDLVATLTDERRLSDCDLMPHQASLLGGVAEQTECASVLLEFLLALLGNRSFSGAWHDCPPFSYAKVFSRSDTAKTAAMVSMQRDWRMLVSFENSRHKNSVAADVFADLQEVVPAAVRIMYLAFENDQWSSGSPAGRRILSCMLQGLPDSKIIEDTHQHLRDLERKGRSKVSSRVCRHRACVDSRQIEKRGIVHKVIEKDHFISHFGQQTTKSLANQFVSRKHKLSADWYQLMEKRDWVSMSPESSRSAVACWQMAKHWFESPEPKPKIANAKASGVLPAGQVVELGGVPSMCVGSTKWGALLCDLELLGARFEQNKPLRLWRLAGKARWVHVSAPSDWTVIPHTAATPDHVQRFFHGVSFGVYVTEAGQPVPLLRHFLGQRIRATFEELKDIFDAEGLSKDGRYRSRDALIRELALHASGGDASFAESVLAMQKTTEKAVETIDPLTEAAFEALDPEEQKEFGDLTKQIQKSRKSSRIAHFKQRLDEKRSTKKKKGGPSKGKKPRAGKKSRARKKGQQQQPPGGVPAGAAASSSGPPPPAEEAEAQPSRRGPRDPETFSWGVGKCVFEFTRRSNPAGWQIKCCLHEKQVAVKPRTASGQPDLACTRQMSEDALTKAIPAVAAGDVNDALIRQLKFWALTGDTVSERSEHMAPSLFKRYVPLAELPSDAELQSLLSRLAKKRRME